MTFSEKSPFLPKVPPNKKPVKFELQENASTEVMVWYAAWAAFNNFKSTSNLIISWLSSFILANNLW